MILRELLAKFGVAYDDKGAKKADKDVSGLKAAATDLIGIIGGAAMIRGFGQFVLGQVEMGDAAGDAAERLGIAVEALQELRYAAVGFGLGSDQVDSALARMGRGAADAAKGQGAAKDAFKELGVTLTDSSGNLLALDQIVMQVSDGLARTTNESDRARLGFDLFGREGSKFTEALKGGSVALEEMREQARALGGVLSEEQVAAADKADKALNAFKFGLQGLKNEIAQRFIPALTKGVGWLLDWVKAARDLASHSHIIEGALIAAGAAFVAFIGGARLLAITKAGIAFGLMAFAIDEIISTAKGGDSVISRFINTLGGMGATQVWIENWKAGFQILVENAKEFVKNLQLGWQLMKETADLRKREKAEADQSLKQHNFENAHAQWERRKKFVEEHPNLPEFMRTVGPEPKAPGASSASGSSFDELRTRRVAQVRGMGAGPLTPDVSGESAEDRALAMQAHAAKLTAAASAPVVVNQTNSLRVTANGADPEAVARSVEKRFRDMQQKGNKQAMRSVRQVPP